MSAPDSALLVFARVPIAGTVKTRLIPALGREGAAALHRELLERTLRTAAAAAFPVLELWCAPEASHGALRELARRYGASARAQQGADLGSRMGAALAAALGNARSAVLVGSDCPELAVTDLHEARDLLREDADLVLGPAEDGGYWLVGLRAPCPGLFENMPWGSGAVLAHTRTRAAQLGLRCRELAERWDVDRAEDLVRYRALAGGGQESSD